MFQNVQFGLLDDSTELQHLESSTSKITLNIE
jgi:hypothetical protein